MRDRLIRESSNKFSRPYTTLFTVHFWRDPQSWLGKVSRFFQQSRHDHVTVGFWEGGVHKMYHVSLKDNPTPPIPSELFYEQYGRKPDKSYLIAGQLNSLTATRVRTIIKRDTRMSLSKSIWFWIKHSLGWVPNPDQNFGPVTCVSTARAILEAAGYPTDGPTVQKFETSVAAIAWSTFNVDKDERIVSYDSFKTPSGT